jgi:hypothetical protein
LRAELGARIYATIHAKVSTATKLRDVQAPAFDVQAFLDSTGVARKVVDFRKKATIFAQGDTAKHVLYIPRGGVKLSLGERLRHRVMLDTELRLEEPFVSLSSSSQKGSHEEANGNDRSLHAIYVCLYPTYQVNPVSNLNRAKKMGGASRPGPKTHRPRPPQAAGL